MKVLMTTDTIGGVWTYALELATALRERQVEVRLATMGAPLTLVQRHEVMACDLAVNESTFRLEWMDEPWDDVAAAGEWLLGIERAWQPDIVHLNGYAHADLPWRAPTLVVAHSCVVSWWRAVHGCDPPQAWDRYRQAVTRGLQAADVVLAPTWAMLESVQQCYGPLNRAGVVSNGRDLRRFAPGRKERLAMAAGRLWDEAKNVSAVAAVAPRLPWPVHVAGESTHPVTGRRDGRGLHALGTLDAGSMAEWLARASMFIHPARYEPFGLGVLEAALSGCALVLGDLPSLRELWDDAAAFVDADDHDALQAVAATLMLDDRHRRELAHRACQRALRLNPQRMATAYHRTYRHLLGRRTVAPTPIDREAG